MMDLFLTNMQLFAPQDIDGLEWCGLLVDYCDQMFGLILTAPIHYKGYIGKQVTYC